MKLRTNTALFKLFQQTERAIGEKDLAHATELTAKMLRLDRRSVEAALFRPPRQKAKTALRAGDAAKDLYDRGIAEHYFRLARELEATSGTEIALAEHLAKTRQEDEATQIVEQLFDQGSHDPRVLLLWGRLHREAPDREARLKGLAAGQVPRIRIFANYELAHHYDAEGDYQAAFRHLLQAKEPLQAPARNLIARRRQVRQRLVELARQITPEILADWRAQELAPLRPCRGLALLAGHPRSGTTLVEQILDSHAELVSVEESENFNYAAFVPSLKKALRSQWIFDALKSLKVEAVVKAREQYLASMGSYVDQPLDGKVLLDKNPSFTAILPAMLRFFPELKTVTMLRDPRDVVLSCFMQAFYPPNEVTSSYLTLEETAAEYADVMGVYAEIRDLLGQQAIEVKYEDLVESPEATARELLDFLGLEWDPQVLEFHERSKSRVVRSPTADAVTEKIHGRARQRWRHYEAQLEPCLEVLAPHLSRWGYAGS